MEMLNDEVANDFHDRQAVRAIKVPYEDRKQKLYRVNRPLLLKRPEKTCHYTSLKKVIQWFPVTSSPSYLELETRLWDMELCRYITVIFTIRSVLRSLVH